MNQQTMPTASAMATADVRPVIAGSAPSLQCTNLSASYGPIQVCFDVNLSCNDGEVVAILGPNGAGKSSLLGAMAGIVSGRGSVRLCGEELGGVRGYRRLQRGLALVPEVRGNIFPVMSVDENLQLVLHTLPRDQRAGMRDFVFELFPILHTRLKTDAGMLSGGEQQMLAIAMAVACKPKALLLDEPTQGLAPAVFDILDSTIVKLTQSGLPIVVAEQNIRFAARVAHRYVVLVGGHLAGEGGAEDLANADAIVERYFPEDLGARDAAAERG